MELILTDEHLNRYLDSLSPEQQKQAGRYAKDFFYFVKDGSKASLDAYFNHIREKYKDSTVKYIWGVIHRFYVVNKLDWPYRRSDTPVIRERTVFAPILDKDVIIEMIKAPLNQRMRFYLAISTTYGCRRTELASLSKPDIDIDNRLIYIATKHLGRERYHIIPEEIVPVIEAYLPRLKPINTKSLDRLFRKIEDIISFPHVKELGWHSIRRCLDKELLNSGIQEHIVMDFLRWKRSDRQMTLRYARGTVIGRDIREDLSIQDRKTDETVFSVHPFLKYWKS